MAIDPAQILPPLPADFYWEITDKNANYQCLELHQAPLEVDGESIQLRSFPIKKAGASSADLAYAAQSILEDIGELEPVVTNGFPTGIFAPGMGGGTSDE